MKQTPEKRAVAYGKRIDPDGRLSMATNAAGVIAYASCIREEVEPLEAEVARLKSEVAKLRALVQVLVDGIETMKQGSFADMFIFASDAELDAHANRLIAAANEQGFTPTNTEYQPMTDQQIEDKRFYGQGN